MTCASFAGSRFRPLLLPGLFIAAIYAGVTLAIAWPSYPVEQRLCDQAVDALLDSKDLVEVERAGMLIRELSCSIGRRLP